MGIQLHSRSTWLRQLNHGMFRKVLAINSRLKSVATAKSSSSECQASPCKDIQSKKQNETSKNYGKQESKFHMF